MYEVNTTAGQTIYGPNYLGMDYFSAIHIKLAGDQVCDHLHDGLGFVNAHIYISNLFEDVLHVLDPSISLPYWDYTIDGEKIKNKFDDNVYLWEQDANNTIMTEDYFGNVDEQGYLINSRFQTAMVVPEATSNDPVHNAYGLLHAPWNLLNDSRVKRAYKDSCYENYTDQYYQKQWSDCDDFFSAKTEGETSFMNFTLAAPYGPHAGVHRFMGTTFDCADIFETLELEYNVSTSVANLMRIKEFVSLKHLYHDGLLSVPDQCDASSGMIVDDAGVITDSPCRYSCPSLEDDLAGIGNHTLLEWLVSALGEDADPRDISTYDIETAEGPFTSLNNNQSMAYLRLLCGGQVKYGDHGTSASATDVSFWPMHPGMERIVHRILIDNYLNGIEWTTDDWPDSYVSWAIRGQPECYGHHLDDYLFTLESEISDTVFLTNREVFETYFTPLGDRPYVFDNLYFGHCDWDETSIDTDNDYV